MEFGNFAAKKGTCFCWLFLSVSILMTDDNVMMTNTDNLLIMTALPAVACHYLGASQSCITISGTYLQCSTGSSLIGFHISTNRFCK